MRRFLLALAASVTLAGAAPAQTTPSPTTPPQPAAAPSFTTEQREEIVSVLRDALRRDPSILRDAIGALQESDRAAQEETRRQALLANAEALFRTADDPIKGNARGDVTIVEFFDARCGYCRSFQPALNQLLQRDRNVRVVLKDLPILGPNSTLASRALLAAQRQGKYEALHDALMRLRTDTPETVIQAEAQRAGLDWARLRRDMDDPAIMRRIETNLALAQRLGVEGTPALVIGDRLIPGAIELPDLERYVREAREGRRG
ncbi:DsbA family protein [Roseomonas sp. CCTCC AB2023176]|uniref:DsbA family protein n=1 Tax=Roseomonas sp. CCTCC AB2023176 TaxID=3342640 RepID=UPI0035D736DF